MEEYTWTMPLFDNSKPIKSPKLLNMKKKEVKTPKEQILSEEAKEAISWFYDEAPDKMTIKEVKEFIAAKWGSEVNEEIKNFFCI